MSAQKALAGAVGCVGQEVPTFCGEVATGAPCLQKLLEYIPLKCQHSHLVFWKAELSEVLELG